ncbi:hypothetical protein [Embleya sp. NPDC005575]|uniref:hypothetical protein n=1 Tax=Embleya sp. NPDC005575 TaxID=3156892 RepID=UPI0033AD2D37
MQDFVGCAIAESRVEASAVVEALDVPDDFAASSLVSPLAISRQNNRSTSRRSEGFPGDFIAALPVNSRIHPANLPIHTSTIEVLRRPVEPKFNATVHRRSMPGRSQTRGLRGLMVDRAARRLT